MTGQTGRPAAPHPPPGRERRPLTAADSKMWRITWPGLDTEIICRAVYATSTDSSLPGWTIFKDHEHKTVIMVKGEPIVAERQPPAP